MDVTSGHEARQALISSPPAAPTAPAAADPPRRSKLAIPLDRIRLDGDTQPRTEIDYALVAEYAELYAAGVKMPPPVVFYDGASYWLVDGFHRWFAARDAKLTKLLCEVRTGSLQDARWFSYAANQSHGLRRTNADKGKAVRAALRHPAGANLSDGQVAAHVGVSDRMVAKYRAELTPKVSESKTRTGRDGRTINTAKIGKGKRSLKQTAARRDPEESAAVAPPPPPPPAVVDVAEAKLPRDHGDEPIAQPSGMPSVFIRLVECVDELNRLTVRKPSVWSMADIEALIKQLVKIVKRLMEEPDLPRGRSKGVFIGHQAINCLMRIPRNDPRRDRGFEIVEDYIRSNRGAAEGNGK